MAANDSRERVTCMVRLRDMGMGSPASPWLLGMWMCPQSIGDGTGVAVKYLLHYIIGWVQ